MAIQSPAISGIADYSAVRLKVFRGAGQPDGNVPASALRSGLQPLDATLTALAALDASTGIVVQTGADTFTKQDWITPWVTYTPTLTGFGTASAVSVWSRRIGDTLMLRGRFTSGTSTSTEARMTLGFNGTNGSLTSNSTKVSAIQLAGPAAISSNLAGYVTVLIESGVGYVTFGQSAAGTSGMAKRNGNDLISSGNFISFTAEIPITGW